MWRRKWVPPEGDDVYGETYVDVLGTTMKQHEIFQSVISPKAAKNPLNVKSYTQLFQLLYDENSGQKSYKVAKLFSSASFAWEAAAYDRLLSASLRSPKHYKLYRHT